MIYKYYKFQDKEAAPKNWPDGVSVSEVGLIKKTEPVYDDRGYVIQPPTYYDGWHVNICYQGDVDLNFVQEFEVAVSNPRQKWFGQ